MSEEWRERSRGDGGGGGEWGVHNEEDEKK